MAERYLFFNSQLIDGEYDREYQANDFADYFGSMLSTGLLHDNNIPKLKVESESGALNTILNTGKAILKGHLYWNTSTLTLAHSIPEATNDRIDRVVIRLDSRNQSRFIKAFVKEGIPDENPDPPDLQRDVYIYELSLAQVRIRANTVQILPEDIYDERLDKDVCGLTYSLLSGQLGDLVANMSRLIDNKGYFNAENVEDALQELRTPLTIKRDPYNVDGISDKVTYFNGETKYKESILSDVDASGNFLTRTVNFYNDASETKRILVYSNTYDADGNLVDENVVSDGVIV